MEQVQEMAALEARVSFFVVVWCCFVHDKREVVFYDVEEGCGAEGAASGCDVTAVVPAEVVEGDESVAEEGVSATGSISLSIS